MDQLQIVFKKLFYGIKISIFTTNLHRLVVLLTSLLKFLLKVSKNLSEFGLLQFAVKMKHSGTGKITEP